MKTPTIILLALSSLNSQGQDTAPDFDGHAWQTPYTLPTPTGWGVERFPIPIIFAPEIPYKGVEDIRFTPGWAKVNSEEYWSYAFLWYLDGDIKMDAKIISSHLKAYYTGLIATNGRAIPSEKLIPVLTSIVEAPVDKGDLKTYTGTIQMLDYMAQKPITLNARVHLKSCPGEKKTFVFYELSPKLYDHAVWVSLDKLWIDFSCKKP